MKEPVFQGHDTLELGDNDVAQHLQSVASQAGEVDQITKFLIDHQGKEIMMTVGTRYQAVKVLEVDPFGKEFRYFDQQLGNQWMDIKYLSGVKELEV